MWPIDLQRDPFKLRVCCSSSFLLCLIYKTYPDSVTLPPSSYNFVLIFLHDYVLKAPFSLVVAQVLQRQRRMIKTACSSSEMRRVDTFVLLGFGGTTEVEQDLPALLWELLTAALYWAPGTNVNQYL